MLVDLAVHSSKELCRVFTSELGRNVVRDWDSGMGRQFGYRSWDARAQRNHTDYWISRAMFPEVCGEYHWYLIKDRRALRTLHAANRADGVGAWGTPGKLGEHGCVRQLLAEQLRRPTGCQLWRLPQAPRRSGLEVGWWWCVFVVSLWNAYCWRPQWSASFSVRCQHRVAPILLARSVSPVAALSLHPGLDLMAPDRFAHTKGCTRLHGERRCPSDERQKSTDDDVHAW